MSKEQEYELICPNYRNPRCDDCIGTCELNSKYCLLDTGSQCSEYSLYLKELADERRQDNL